MFEGSRELGLGRIYASRHLVDHPSHVGQQVGGIEGRLGTVFGMIRGTFGDGH